MTHKDILGNRFGKLEVIEFSHIENQSAMWICECDCGNRKTMRARDIPGNKSCGRCRVVPVSMESNVAAWSAGFFDGEGNVTIRHKKRVANTGSWFMLVMSITNTNLESLQSLKDSFGFGCIHARKCIEGRKQCYAWMLSDRSAEAFARTIIPYSIVKKTQLHAAIAFRELGQRRPYEKVPESVYDEMSRLAQVVRDANGNNHRKNAAKIVPKTYVEV